MSTLKHIDPLIHFIKGRRVMLDSDLAKIYGVTTARLNQQVRRNLKKFPGDFMLQLNSDEFEHLMLQNATSRSGHGGRRKRPFVFTEHGALMAATILNSPQAITMSLYVVRAFIKIREALASNKELSKKHSDLERKLTKRLDIHEDAILRLFAEIRELFNPPRHEDQPKRKIGFNRDCDAIRSQIATASKRAALEKK